MIEAAFRLLRLSRDATPEEARDAWVRLVRRYPPEHFPEKFAAIRRAYQQVTLDDDFIEESLQRFRGDESPLLLAAFLWEDRMEEATADLKSLKPLLSLEQNRQALDEMLETISPRDIEWRK